MISFAYSCFYYGPLWIWTARHLVYRRNDVEVTGHNGGHRISGQAKEKFLISLDFQRCKCCWFAKKYKIHIHNFSFLSQIRQAFQLQPNYSTKREVIFTDVLVCLVEDLIKISYAIHSLIRTINSDVCNNRNSPEKVHKYFFFTLYHIKPA